MLASCGVSHCIVGHSEARKVFRQSNTVVRRICQSCFSHDITPVLCVGADLLSESVFSYSQLTESIQNFTSDQISRIVIAFEIADTAGPLLSVSTIQDAHSSIRKALRQTFGVDAASRTRILYAGPLPEPSAAGAILRGCGDVDGFLLAPRSAVDAQAVDRISRITAKERPPPPSREQVTTAMEALHATNWYRA